MQVDQESAGRRRIPWLLGALAMVLVIGVVAASATVEIALATATVLVAIYFGLPAVIGHVGKRQLTAGEQTGADAVAAARNGATKGTRVAWDPRLNPVVDAFAMHLPDSDTIDIVADSAGLGRAHVRFGSNPHHRWHHLLTRARAETRLEDVFSRVLHLQPHPDVRSAISTFRGQHQ